MQARISAAFFVRVVVVGRETTRIMKKLLSNLVGGGGVLCALVRKTAMRRTREKRGSETNFRSCRALPLLPSDGKQLTTDERGRRRSTTMIVSSSVSSIRDDRYTDCWCCYLPLRRGCGSCMLRRTS